MEQLRRVIREKFEGLFENSLDPILVHDNKGIIIDVNYVLLKLFNFSREQLLNKSVTTLLRKEDMYQAINAKQELLKSGKVSKTSIYLVKLANNSPMYFEVYSIPFKKDGKIVATINISHDITEKKKAEEKVKEAEKKYQIAYRRENFYKDVFTHDTRNLLQVLLSSIELCMINLANNSPLVKIQEILNFCKLQILRGAYIVNTVKRFSDIAQIKRQISKTDVSYYLNKAINSIKEYSHGKIAKIIVKYNSQYLHVNADKFLGDAFEHIILNAIHHNLNPDVEIEIIVYDKIENDIEYTRLEFIDNGPGIPDFQKELIFKDNSNYENIESRTGLGIYLIKAIIEPYDAQFWVENKVPGNYSKGSKFILAFHQN